MAAAPGVGTGAGEGRGRGEGCEAASVTAGRPEKMGSSEARVRRDRLRAGAHSAPEPAAAVTASPGGGPFMRCRPSRRRRRRRHHRAVSVLLLLLLLLQILAVAAAAAVHVQGSHFLLFHWLFGSGHSVFRAPQAGLPAALHMVRSEGGGGGRGCGKRRRTRPERSGDFFFLF